ncbi:Cloroperoxidase, partial [Tothia fuscella]
WIPASQINGASRTSCPYLNTAANHGFLPRNGRQISIAQFDQSIIDSINFHPDFAHAITMAMLGKLGVLVNNTEQDASLRLDLEQTNVHDKTEHDASISRFDLSQGNNKNVQTELVQDLLDDTLPMAYNYLNTSSVGRTRVRRERESLKLGNPPLPSIFFSGAQGEAGLLLTVMSDGSSPITSQNADFRRAPKERIKSWLVNERFPTEQGFKRS